MSLFLRDRISKSLQERQASGLERSLGLPLESEDNLDLSSNDYLGLAKDERLADAAKEAIDRFGCSSSASPLITGYRSPHDDLIQSLKHWAGFESGLVWNTGYAANSSLLSLLPQKGDIVLADRLIHRSMIAGILNSGARLIRYRHCDVAHLSELLSVYSSEKRQIFVVTESVFSMDGDYPDLKEIAGLKEEFEFFWMVDEAHALGWYGKNGSGLVEEMEVTTEVDALVGTMGKAMGSMGAYTLFHDDTITRYLINFASEFIYSTYLAPSCAAAAEKALKVIEAYPQRGRLREQSIRFRNRLRELGYDVPECDSPIVPIRIGNVVETMALSQRLNESGLLVGAIRPPTVPDGESRLRLSLKADMSDALIDRVIAAFRKGSR